MTRLRIINRLIIAGFLSLSSALIYFQVIQFSKYYKLSQTNRIRILPQSASRGCILDRNGEVLAGNTLSYDLMIMPSDKGNYPTEQISLLASILSISEEELKERYRKGYTTPFAPVLLYNDVGQSQALTISQLKYELPGVIVQVNPRRIYPLGKAACHLLGYLSQIDTWRLEQLREYGYKIQDLVGWGGIEEVYDYLLRPRDGGMQVEIDNKGRLRRILGFRAPQKGQDIELTIDLRLQKIIYNNLVGHTGCVIILNPVNGEVFALVSFPDFDPQVFQGGALTLVKQLFKDPDAPLLNRAINGLYSPGSVFKIVVAAAGLEKKKINVNSKFFCKGQMQIGNRTFRCWDSHEGVNIIKGLAHSCNIFFYNLGLRLGPQLINEYALRFGFNQSAGIDLPGESKGSLPYSLWERIKRQKKWFSGDTANLSIGQGDILVTPLQIARMMAAIANDGKLIKPRLLKSIMDEGQAVNLPVSKETLQIIKRGLIGGVEEAGGTANVLANPGISIAGKTGTAQVASGQPHGWFVGYFPIDKPRFVICVFLEHAGSGYYCCQLTKKIIQQMLAEGLI